MKRLIPAFLLFLAGLFSLSSCTPSGGTLACSANFIGDGFSVYVSHVQNTTYKFEVCSNTKYSGSVYSVFASSTATDLAPPDPVTKGRSSHLSGVDRPGDTFEITFRSEDLWFAIYKDKLNGSSYEFSFETELVRGDLSQVPLVPASL